MFTHLYIKSFCINSNTPDFQESYLSSVPVLRHMSEFEFHKNVTFFVGENGSGKSTLLEALAVCYGLNAEGGSKNFNFSTRQSHSALYKSMHMTKGISLPKDSFFLRAESFYNVATMVEKLELNLDGYGGTSLHDQSHGESFLSLILNRFRGHGLYILDEPEAALSPARQLALLSQMQKLVKRDSQFIIATHSPLLTAYPDAEIYVLDECGLKLTPYRETENYTLTRQFLNNPEKMLHYLFEE